MKINLRPDNDMSVQKQKIGSVPTLILKPKTIKPPGVGLLWIHGGGYITGMKEMVYMSRAVDILKRYGATVFSPGYRLAWLHPYPAAVNDCFAVFEYMDKHRAELGFDRIMVGGESAGSGLCAAVCMMARDRGIRVAYQFPLYPMLSNLDTESGDAKKAVLPYASPAQQTDYHGLPPCYTFVGEGEPFYAETLQYVASLKAAGVEAEVDVYPTDVHAFDMLYPEQEVAKQASKKLLEQVGSVFAHDDSSCQSPLKR